MLERIGRNIGKIFLGIVAIALFLFGYQCGRDNNTLKTNSKTITDTLLVTKVDTIKPLPEIKWYALKPIIKIDTIIKSIYLDSTECNRIYVYEDTIKTKDYDLYRKSYVQGKLRFDTTGVKLKIPLIINNTTTVSINNHDTIIKSNKWDIKVGILAGFNTLAPTIDYTKNRTTYMIAYDPFNKIPYIGIKYTIFKSKK